MRIGVQVDPTVAGGPDLDHVHVPAPDGITSVTGRRPARPSGHAEVPSPPDRHRFCGLDAPLRALRCRWPVGLSDAGSIEARARPYEIRPAIAHQRALVSSMGGSRHRSR